MVFSAVGQAIKFEERSCHLPPAELALTETQGAGHGRRLVTSQLEQPSAEIKSYLFGT